MDITSLYQIYLQHPVICTDTRSPEPGAIFFALRGASFNGNTFALQALNAGCSYAVVDDPSLPSHPQLLQTANVLETLQQLATHHRKQITIPVIGLTGSNGKTTTKELLHAVLSGKYNCLSTSGNLNNHIGVPLTLLRIRPQHEIAIVEMGANQIGEIAFLCDIAGPDAGLITNIGKAHLEGFGGPAGVLQAKTELYKYLQKNGGRIFLNAEDDLLANAAGTSNIFTYGTSTDADISGDYQETDVYMKFTFRHNGVTTDVNTQLTGSYNFYNALAATAIGVHYGVGDAAIKNGIEKYVPSNNRSQVEIRGTNTLILDAYNANPSSMRLAVENALSLPNTNKLFILGDMRELGEYSYEEHKNILDLLQGKAKNVILVGSEFGKFTQAYPFLFFPTSSAASAWLKSNKPENTLILVKGSRGIKLENVLESL